MGKIGLRLSSSCLKGSMSDKYLKSTGFDAYTWNAYAHKVVRATFSTEMEPTMNEYNGKECRNCKIPRTSENGVPGFIINAAEIPRKYRAQYTHVFMAGAAPDPWGTKEWTAEQFSYPANFPKNVEDEDDQQDYCQPMNPVLDKKNATYKDSYVWVPASCFDPETNELGEIAP